MSGKKMGRTPGERTPSSKKEAPPSSDLRQPLRGSGGPENLPLKQKRQQFQRSGRVASELTLIEEIVELSADELILSAEETGEISSPNTPSKIHPASTKKAEKHTSKTTTTERRKSTIPQKPTASTSAAQKRSLRATQEPFDLLIPTPTPTPTPTPLNHALLASVGLSRPASPTTPKAPSPLDTAIGVKPQLTETASHFLFPEEPLTPLPRTAKPPHKTPDTAPELVARTPPEMFQTEPDIQAIPDIAQANIDLATHVPHADTQDDLTPLTEEDALMILDEAAPPLTNDAPASTSDTNQTDMARRLQRIDQARQNYQLLKHHLHTQSTEQLCLDDDGRLATSAASAATIIVPQRHGDKLMSLCVPTGLAKDEEGQLCEAYLVLRKLPNEPPVWSHALASLQATEHRDLQFIEWGTVKEEMLLLLNDEQREQILYLLAPEFSSILQDPLYPPDDKKPHQPLRLKPTPLPFKAPTRPAQTSASAPEKATKPAPPIATNQAHARPTRPVTGAAAPAQKPNSRRVQVAAVQLDVTAPVSARRVSDDTAVRRIQLKTAPLDPKGLRLHVNIPGSLHGKGFQPMEEILQTTGERQELKLPMLGIKIEFTYNEGSSGKVFPRIIVTRSTNVRNIQYAAYDIQLFANKNPQAEARFDHVQELPRGHMASIDLSPTDQLRGVMLLTVTPPQSKTYAETIHCSWSVVE